ncbi:hypothetical protein RP20_CCG008796 [Aedes albopictus]|nr:hypothetical protein RP20_CCG008796 [Aedes albopictus]
MNGMSLMDFFLFWVRNSLAQMTYSTTANGSTRRIPQRKTTTGLVGRRHTVSHPRRRTGGVAANPDHRNHRHCFLPIQQQHQHQHQQLQQRSSNPGSPSSTSAMTAMTDSTLTMIEPCSGGGGAAAGPSSGPMSLSVSNNTGAGGGGFGIIRDNSLRLKPCLSFGATSTTSASATAASGSSHKGAVGLEMVTMRTPQRKGSFQVLLKKDSVRSRSSFVCEL